MNVHTDQPAEYTIKEAAKLSGLPESTLRYYETIGLIPKVSRDKSSKYRVYREADLDYIISIACLSATGMSIDTMQSYLSNAEKGVAAAKQQIDLLNDQHLRLEEEEKSIRKRREYLRVKASYWKAIEDGDTKIADEISKKAVAIAKEIKKT